MVDESKKPKKGTISEESTSILLRRYSVNTVFALLQEVSQVAGDKINWPEMAKNTTTGISDAREYQSLWRHLAYGETLVDQSDHDQNPMDDDSDLEFEMDAFPSVGREVSSEAAACVKVLIASGHTNDSHLSNSATIDAPLTISIPNSKPLLAPSDSSLPANARQGIHFTIPVSLQKVPSSGSLGEKRPTNEATGVNVPPKRKRRCWSTKEDLKLTAAANKNLEPNWDYIASVEFNDDRKANELSQRWAFLKKKQGNLKLGTNVKQPDQLAAAHRAMSMALDRPMSDNLKAASAGLTSQQPQKPSALPPVQPLGRGGPPNPQVPTKRPPMNPTPLTPDSMVKAAAVAAGARIASSADASSLLEAARSQNVVHITTGGAGSSLMRPAVTSQLPSNVHFIRNGLAKAPISTYSAAKPSAQSNPAAHVPLYKSSEDAVVSTLGNVAKEVSKHSQVAGPTDMSGSTPVERVPEKSAEDVVVSTLGNVTKEVSKQSQVAGPTDMSGSTPVERVPEKSAEDVVVSTLGNVTKEVSKHSQVAGPTDMSSSTPVERVPEKSAEDVVVSTLGNVTKEVSKHSQVAGPTDMSSSTPVERVPEKTLESHVKPAGQAEDDRVGLQSSETEDNGKKNSEKEDISNVIHENEGGDAAALPNKTVDTSEIK